MTLNNIEFILFKSYSIKSFNAVPVWKNEKNPIEIILIFIQC